MKLFAVQQYLYKNQSILDLTSFYIILRKRETSDALRGAYTGSQLPFLPPGTAPLSRRTVSSLSGVSPPPGTWRPVPLQLAGRGHSCRRPIGTH